MTTPPRTPDPTVPPTARRRGPDGRFRSRSERAADSGPDHTGAGSTKNADATAIEPTEPAVTHTATPDDATTASATTTVPAGTDAELPELPEDRFLNRELSWLDFNAR